MPRPTQLDPALLTLRLQSGGPLSAQALADTLGVDRVTVQRAVRKLTPHILQLGVTRGTRYALRRPIANQTKPVRIYRFNLDRTLAHEWLSLSALYGGWHIEWASHGVTPEWADQVHDHAGFCDGLPFFLTDLRPQGFLGRAIARRLPPMLGFSPDPRAWSDDQTLQYLIGHGEDLPGNLAIGDSSAAKALGFSNSPVTYSNRAEHYPALATQADAGEAVGSSVEGEQPKFTTHLHDTNSSNTQAVLVKFTDRLDTPTGRRWADLLACEAAALNTLRDTTAADAESLPPEVFDFQNRRFYQLPRFDRIGTHGRRGIVTLRALYDAGFSQTDTNDWPVAAEGLHTHGWISGADLDAIRLRHTFGQLIGNTDMHFGNLAFVLDLGLPLRLAPVYDMLPMLWAPRTGNAEPNPAFSPPPPLPLHHTIWSQAATLALTFWQSAANHSQVSAPFRAIAEQAHASVKTLHDRFG